MHVWRMLQLHWINSRRVAGQLQMLDSYWVHSVTVEAPSDQVDPPWPSINLILSLQVILM